ncbi:MAG: helix-turn-helix transcriptional regulator [Thermoleophilia bacterium]
MTEPASTSDRTTMEDPLITAAETAARLNVSVRTVHLWIASGKLPAVRLSPRCTRVPAVAVDELVRASTSPRRPDLAPLLWDTDPARIDEERDSKFLVARILTAGRPEHVAWMFRRYPRSLIESTIASDRRLSGRVAGGWRNLLGLHPAEAA